MNPLNRLHKPVDRNGKHDSMTAFQVSFYPWSKLSLRATKAISWQKSLVLTKEQVLANLNEEQSQLYFPKDSSLFQINWEYNNIPTEQVWSGLPSDHLIRVQFRISHLAQGTGRVALLTLMHARKGELMKDAQDE